MQLLVDRFLHSLASDTLHEVARRVEETDADKGQSKIAGLLAMVAGEDAQTAGVDGQRLAESKFRREIGDGFIRHFRVVALLRGLFQQRGLYLAQETHRIVPDVLP